MSDFCVYGHFAKEDFTDLDGNFHPKDSCCYIGSGTKYRSSSINQSTRSATHGSAKEFLEVRILQDNLPSEEKVKMEMTFYDHYVSLEHNLFNKHRPRDTKIYSLELFNKYLYLDPYSPSYLSWKIDRYTGKGLNRLTVKAGTPAGCIGSCGYWEIRMDKSLYLGHRVVYCLVNSTDIGTSNYVIDHINNIRSDNHPDNLRFVPQHINVRNSLARSLSTSGITGVTLKPKQHCWRASVHDLNGNAIEKLFYFMSPLRKKNWSANIEYLEYDTAFQMAMNWRNSLSLGFGYITNQPVISIPPISYEDYLKM